MSKALVIFSGGQDSTTCLLQAIRDYGKENVETISFAYGQKHERELTVAAEIVKELGVNNVVMDTSLLGQIANSSLLKGGGEFAQGEKYPNTFVDGRNMVFLLMAAIYAKSKGIKDIFIGVGEADYSGYPDCRDIFIKSCNVSLNLAMDYEFNIIAPLMWLNKKQVWALADSLGKLEFVKNKTHTCYENVAGGCGQCPACILRIRGLEEYMKEKENG